MQHDSHRDQFGAPSAWLLRWLLLTCWGGGAQGLRNGAR
jgi:hypothetical protein